MNTRLSNYLITYTAYDKNGSVIKDGKMKVKNKQSKFEAQCSFEEYLKKKHKNFNKLVIHSCQDDFLNSIFGGFMNGNNPFSF